MIEIIKRCKAKLGELVGGFAPRAKLGELVGGFAPRTHFPSTLM